ncbi:unnamed protein product [Caenorhabditis angaria]|uniref:Uncharacterized protein n=1 Tax=Caenorhabditis angaria TaxID=860376 RepID=A0A9P1I5X5_9PELO|nr:unnamed protein product [Caenorhabditis angaria]
MTDNLLQCYNKGCGKKFSENENGQEACSYHPGPPYFHDAYKIWNCCNKKSTDFGTWLSYPGCARGKHNPEKPVDIVKVAAVKEIRPEKEEDVIVWKGLNKSAKKENIENSGNKERPLVDLKFETTPSAEAAIEKFLNESKDAANSGEFSIGAACKNNGCDKTYDGSNSIPGDCQNHPGEAIFHEGMKYWSCCNKKTSNFGAFLEQVGCTKSEHRWRPNEIVSKVREDWFSSNGFVTVNIYCRGTIGKESRLQTDGHVLKANLVHGFGTKETALEYDLWDEVIVEESRAVIGERKVEIVLKQKYSTGWPRLKFDPELDEPKKEQSEA